MYLQTLNKMLLQILSTHCMVCAEYTDFCVFVYRKYDGYNSTRRRLKVYIMQIIMGILQEMDLTS